MPWTEPEPVGDLRSVDALLRRAVEVAAGSKPVWPIIQLTGAAWSQDMRLDPAGNGRPPTPEEYRCMVYLALARGANGLFSYAYHVPRPATSASTIVSAMPPACGRWCGEANAGMQALTPVLLEGEPVAVEGRQRDGALRGYQVQRRLVCDRRQPVRPPVPAHLPACRVCRASDLEVAFDTRKLAGRARGQFARPARAARGTGVHGPGRAIRAGSTPAGRADELLPGQWKSPDSVC